MHSFFEQGVNTGLPGDDGIDMIKQTAADVEVDPTKFGGENQRALVITIIKFKKIDLDSSF